MTSTTSTEEPQTGYDNPVVIRCKGCGAPVHFDIVKQNFRCPTCGAEMPCAEGLEGRRSWHKSQQMKVMEAAKASKEQLYQCEGCGAQVIVHAHDTLGHCQFCGGTLVGRGWAGSDLLPAIVIPFYLTAQEAQAQLEAWCKQHSHRKEAKLLKPGLENLEGYYLPYELVKGTAIATSTWASSTRTYHCRCYLDGTAVNTSSQTDNQLLDGVEPFDFAAARPFDFHMLGGCNAKLQDVDEQKFRERVAIEVNEDVARTLKAQFRTSRAEVDTHPQELLVLPVLLPLYLLSYNGIQAAVNGQTGRVAVARRKVRMNYSFYWEPLAITFVLTGIVDALYYYLNLGDDLWGVTWVSGALIAFIIFMLYFGLRKPAPYPPILRGENVKAQRDGHRKLTIERNQGEKPAVEAVFYEKLRSGVTPVNIRFYSIGRIASWIGQFALGVCLPYILGYGITLLNGKPPELIYGGLWAIFATMFGIGGLVACSRLTVYDHPLLFHYPQSHRRIPGHEYLWPRRTEVWGMFFHHSTREQTDMGPSQRFSKKQLIQIWCLIIIPLLLLSSLWIAGYSPMTTFRDALIDGLDSLLAPLGV